MKELYAEGKYAEQYPEWHLADSPGKVKDLLPSILALIDKKKLTDFKIADIGAGVGGVLSHLQERLHEVRPSVNVQVLGYEISPYAVEAAKKLFPEIEMRQRSVASDDGPFDVALFVDVLEHLENPWEILRDVRKVASHIAVRQPLLESFSTFRTQLSSSEVTLGPHRVFQLLFIRGYGRGDGVEAPGYQTHSTVGTEWEPTARACPRAFDASESDDGFTLFKWLLFERDV